MAETRLPSLSIFFPCYNEELNVPLLIRRSIKLLPQIAKKGEIIIINDGSRDQTGSIADALAKKFPQVKVIHHPHNRGYGAALQSGFKAARYKWTFFTDGDLQFKLKQLKVFIPYAKEFEVMVGYRRKRAEGFRRAFNARLFKLFIDVLFRVHVKDIDCAFKLMKTELVQSIPLEATGAFISAELLYKLKKRHVLIKQLPVDHIPRKYGKPTGSNLKVIIRAGYEALKLYVHIKLQSLQGKS